VIYLREEKLNVLVGFGGRFDLKVTVFHGFSGLLMDGFNMPFNTVFGLF
jgi:hypothetical protein